MYTDEVIRDGLTDLADQVRPSEDPAAQILGRVRGHRRRCYLAGGSALAVVAVVLAASMTQLLGGTQGQVAAPPPDGPFLGWGAAGDAAGGGLNDRVRQQWDAAAPAGRSVSGGPHTQARTLLATDTESLGLVVVAQAYDGSGQARIAFFTGGPTSGTGLVLRADRPAPDPVKTQVVSLVSARLGGPARTVSGEYWGAYAIALAMPGITSTQVSSTTVDEEMRSEGAGRAGRFRVQPLPISSTALTTTVRGYHEEIRQFTVPVDGGALGDADLVTGQVLTRSARELTVSVGDAARVEPGQLAATGSGLVGRVASVDRATNQAVIELVTADGFRSPAYTDISNHKGQVAGDGAKLRLQDLPSGADVNPGNRVLVPDPAQRDERAGAVTVARAASASSGSTSVALTVTADLTTITTLSIMVPSAQS